MTVKPLLGGRYQFIKTLGSETNDATYLVGDTQLQGHPKCVIKRLSFSGKGPRTQRFILVLLRRKAESLQRIGKHDQIPRILDFFEEQDHFCLVEEFIPGRPLSAILKPKQPLPESVAIQLLKAILKILTVVHSWGVIHRCITPANIIQRQSDGKLVLTGFGIFREISAQGRPKPPSVPSTPDHRQVYVSLNHINGERHFNGDIYAVGMIGIQALTGSSTLELAKLRRSWRRNGTAASTHPHWSQSVSVSLGLRLVLDRMIHEDSEQRYQTVTEVLEDLRQISGEPSSSQAEAKAETPPSGPQPQSQPRPKSPPQLSRPKFIGFKPRESKPNAALPTPLASPVQESSAYQATHQATHQATRGTNEAKLPGAAVDLRVDGSEQVEPKTSRLDRRLWLAIAAIAVILGLGSLMMLTRLPQRSLAAFYQHQGQEDFDQGHYGEAIAHYSDALSQHQTGQTYLQRGKAYHKQEQWREAQADLSQAIQLNPALGVAYYYRGDTRYRLGNRQDALDDWREAQTDFSQVIQLNPELGEVYFYRGATRYRLGDRQGALDDYTEAITRLPQNSPQFTRAYVNRGTIRGELGDETGAIEDYSIAIQTDPSLAAAYLNRCLSHSNLDDHNRAIADCSQAIRIEPNSSLAYQNRALVRRRLGDITGALEDLKIAINLDPDDPEPYYNRGLIRQELGDNVGAIDDFSSVISRDPDHAYVYYDRGLVRADIGDNAGAIADLRTSAKLCLDAGRQGCYEDAQYQISQIQPDIDPVVTETPLAATGQDAAPIDRLGLILREDNASNRSDDRVN
ncbi:MAG: tetratricopeptide repeat protein [Leptolyngbyaceae cyanobacterium]